MSKRIKIAAALAAAAALGTTASAQANNGHHTKKFHWDNATVVVKATVATTDPTTNTATITVSEVSKDRYSWLDNRTVTVSTTDAKFRVADVNNDTVTNLADVVVGDTVYVKGKVKSHKTVVPAADADVKFNARFVYDATNAPAKDAVKTDSKRQDAIRKALAIGKGEGKHLGLYKTKS